MTGAENTAVPGNGLEPCRSGRMLIVDDERSLLDVFKLIISMEIPDVAIDVAEDGSQALNAFGQQHHSLLLMDLRMPVMDGRQAFMAIESLCGERKWAMPSVIFCSGYAPPDSIRRVVSDSPFHELLSKPVENDVLVDAVRSRLSL